MTDSFLFIAILQVSLVKISILCVLLNPIVYTCSFQLHFHFNKTQMNTIVPDLNVSKIHTNTICTELTNHTNFIV